MRLIIESNHAQNATIPIRWCLNQDERTWLKDQKADPEKTFILISILNGYNETGRYLVPIGDLMTFLVFRKPGNNSIKAVVVMDISGPKSYFCEALFLAKRGDDYRRNVLLSKSFDFQDFGENFNARPLTASSAEIEIEVDEQFFATKPWDWKWTNLWFKIKPKDKCQFRKRRFLSFTIQPPLMALWYPIFGICLVLWCGIWRTICKTFAAAGLLLWGIKPTFINWQAFHFSEDIEEITEPPEHLNKWNWSENKDRFQGCSLYRPVFILPALGIIAWLNPWSAAAHHLNSPATVTLLFVMVLLFVLAAALQRYIEITKRFIPEEAKKQYKLLQEQARIRKVRLAHEAKLAHEAELAKQRESAFELIACNHAAMPRIEELPKEKQTFHLRFWDLKAKVCRHFAV